MTSIWRLVVGMSVVVVAVVFSLLAASSFGAVAIDLTQLVTGQLDSLHQQIWWQLRLPRVLLAFIAGAGLSLAGAVLQMVTRNPLADPYLFGISAGASLGAVVVLSGFAGSLVSVFGLLNLPIGAFIGACLSVILVVGISGHGLHGQVERMLLAGVATSFMLSALASLLLYMSDPMAAASVLFWTLGSFSAASWQGLWLPGGVVLASLGILLAMKRQLLAMLGGDETAHTLGLKVTSLRLKVLLLCSLITATLVASCGGIGFVGLMIPHTVRLLLPGRQPLLLIALAGGTFMVWVDVLARLVIPNQELPVGVITAALGSVFFLFVLKRRQQEHYV
ncbi:iron ABC transporter permease [Shewanella sp. NIFS-20-20]|uniref:FecCD family ABC transporter permease n=1 Tax=Shewanella sp. NIFS-20-20 TaxID=2853806 RepID=UPI00210CE5D9|nr:iron ABC transporter permease [Shewanella sp. NIFS-20-20]